MDNFNLLELPQVVLASLEQMNFTAPTPIQKDTIPPALLGRDILGSAPTGTGKTGAFSIPMIAWLLKNKDGRALIMTPTRELATQVLAFISQLSRNTPGMQSALLIGGDSFYRQKQQLQRNPRIIVGTPGRINDHINQQTLDLSNVGYLVLDETDRMLDMGFREQLQTILDTIPSDHQTLLFSATLPKYILDLSKQYLNNEVRVSVGSSHIPVDRIKQETIHTTEGQKYDELLAKLETHAGSVIVFAKTKHGCDRLAARLRTDQHNADAIHGDLNQRARDRVIRSFREQKFRVLVATDVAARGLDIRHIECVINFDLPQCPEDYIHRVGRTARAGAEGHAVNFVTSIDGAKWRAICKLINPNEKVDMPYARSERGQPRRRAYGHSSQGSSNDSRRPRQSFDNAKSGFDRNRRPGERAPGSFAERSAAAAPHRETRERRSASFSDSTQASPRSHFEKPAAGFAGRKFSEKAPFRAHAEKRSASSESSSSRPGKSFQSFKKPSDTKWEPRAKKTYKARVTETA